MKINPIPEIIRRLSATVGGFALFTGTLHAAPFIYSSGDLLLALRQTGNASDLVVNIGKATNYSAVPAGATFVVTNLSAVQLGSTFPSVNGLSWSVAAAIRTSGNPAFPFQTLWATSPRTDPALPSAPWLRFGQFIQGNASSQIDAIGNNAAAYSSSQSSNANNTATGVAIPTSSDYALAQVLGDSGNYANTFQGNVQNTTATDFDSDANNVARSDLYELLPGTSAGGTLNTPGHYLGYFELKPDGTLTFNTITPPTAAPTITSIVRNGIVTTISLTTVANVTYRLRVSNAGLTSPVSEWAVGGSIAGSGSVLTLQDTNSTDSSFYAVEAQSQ